VARVFTDGFGCSVTGYDAYSTVDGVGAAADLPALLRGSDLVTLHVPLTEATRGLIGEPELALMPRGGYLVNASRGGVIDQGALVDALVRGQLAGAGLDVFEAEPVPADSPLLALDTVVLSPHVGYLSPQSLRQARRQTVEDLIAVLAGGPTVHTLL
jgi:phosphoglycerate dehydrogenase-like enzyme